MDLSYIATWYIIGFFISFIFTMFDSNSISEISYKFLDNLIASIFSWLFVLLFVTISFKELLDNKK